MQVHQHKTPQTRCEKSLQASLPIINFRYLYTRRRSILLSFLSYTHRSQILEECPGTMHHQSIYVHLRSIQVLKSSETLSMSQGSCKHFSKTWRGITPLLPRRSEESRINENLWDLKLSTLRWSCCRHYKVKNSLQTETNLTRRSKAAHLHFTASK